MTHDDIIEIENDSMAKNGDESKKRRLLIGKNVDKKLQPDLSYSTLEPIRSQLNSIIADATLQMSLQDELEKSHQLQSFNTTTLTVPNTSLNTDQLGNSLKNVLSAQAGEILTVNGNLLNGVLLTMNRGGLPPKNMLSNPAVSLGDMNLNLNNCGPTTTQPIFIADLMGNSNIRSV